MPPDALLRTALLLTATGIVSASSVRFSLNEATASAFLPFAFAFYMALLVVASPRKPPRWAAPLAFVFVGTTYVLAGASAGANPLWLAAWMAFAAVTYALTPGPLRPLTVAGLALWTPALHLFRPEPAAADFAPLIALASIVAIVNLIAELLDRRSTEERGQRLGLAVLAVAVVATVAERHLVVTSAGVAPDDVLALTLVLAVPPLARVPIPPPRRDALVTGLVLSCFLLTAMALLLGKGYHVDAVTVPHRAAELLLAGTNPYRTFDLPEALARFGLDPQLVTHYEDGSVVRALSYPALAFLPVVPFVAAGLSDIRWIYFAEVAFGLLLLLRRVRLSWRPFVLAAAVGNTVLLRQSILAGVDPSWAVLLLIAWLYIGSRWVSSLSVGLALAARQPAWFVAPFYLVGVWRREGGREALRRGAIAALAAIVPNVPFALDAPAGFFAGITSPMLAALPPHGVGLVGFGIEGLLPLWPRLVYGALSATALAVLVVVAWRYGARAPLATVVSPFVPLYLAWRSLQNYFAWTPLHVIAADEELLEGVGERRTALAHDTASGAMPTPRPTSTTL